MQSASNILNSNFRDKYVSEIDYKNIKVSDGDSYLIPFIKKIIEIIKIFAKETFLYNRIFVHGTSFVLNQPEFIDIKKIHNLISIIENEYLLTNMLLNFQKMKIL